MKHGIGSCCAMLLLSVCVNATQINVPADYATIQEAVDSAGSGDTVLVAAGTYYEHVDIGGDLYLLGEGMSETIIDAGDTARCITVLDFAGSQGRISGFTMQNSGNDMSGLLTDAGLVIHTTGLGNWTVDSCFFPDNPKTGIMTTDTGVIERCIFEGSVTAVFISSDARTTVRNCTFRDNIKAVYAHPAAARAVVENNIITGSTTGIQASESTEQTIHYNLLWDNTLDYSGCSGGTGSLSEDPLLVGGTPFNYHLGTGSPCIDAGNPDSPQDPDNTRIDIGAYYSHQTGIFRDLLSAPDCGSTFSVTSQPDAFLIRFRPGATPEGDVLLRLWDTNGAMVMHSRGEIEDVQGGRLRVAIGRVPPGAYLLSLRPEGSAEKQALRVVLR